MCVSKRVIKVINVNKYKSNPDNVTRNISVEIEIGINVHSDVKHSVK